MTLGELFTLLKDILFSREVIIVTVVIALYLNLVTYVVRYRKQSFRAKKPWRRVKVKREKAVLVEEGEDDLEDEDTIPDED